MNTCQHGDVSPSKSKSRITAAGLVVSLCFATTVLVAAPASAYTFLCGKYAGSNPTITYRFYDVTLYDQDRFNEAQNAWDATSAPGYFTPTTGSDPMVEFRDDFYAWGAWAQTLYTCTSGTWTGDEVEIQYNHRTTGGLGQRDDRMILEHELGHAYGLNHSGLTCAAPGPSVMVQGEGKFACGGTPPWAEDVNGVTDRYN